MIVFIDCETRSEADLKEVGAHVYATDQTTEVLCVTYAFNDEPVQLWDVLKDKTCPPRLQGVFDGWGNKALFVGHNIANFDRLILQHVLGLYMYSIQDTMVLAYAMSLPGSLESAAISIGLPFKKDMAGNRVMLQLSRPRTKNPTTWWTPESAPEKFEALHKYAMSDIEVTRALYIKLVKLSPHEEQFFELDMKINERGVPVDINAVKKAIELVNSAKACGDRKMRDLTGNAVASCNATAMLADWIRSQGVECEGVSKPVITALLDKEIPENVREVLLLRQEMAKSSTAKLEAMLLGAGDDGRIRGCFQYLGANTRRWAGRRVQLQNLARGKNDPKFWESLKLGSVEKEYASPMSVVASQMRGFLKAPAGKTFLGMDFASIEARGLAWLAGQEDVLQVFRDGQDIYKVAAASIYKTSVENVTPEQRQIGKIAALALGFQGGKGAFLSMAKNYGVTVSEEDAEEIKTAWRLANPKIVSYWYTAERCLMEAIEVPDTPVKFGPKDRQVTAVMRGTFLWVKLPSKGILCYPFAERNEVTTPWKEKKTAMTYMTQNSVTRKWERTTTFGGSLVENFTQSLCRDILAEAMFRLEYPGDGRPGFPVVIHVHDSITVEVGSSGADRRMARFKTLALQTPDWAKGFPIDGSFWSGKRFKG